MAHTNPLRVLGDMPEGQAILRGQSFGARDSRWGYSYAVNIVFTPSGTISATNVQAAIEEVAAEAIPTTSLAGILAFAAAHG